jgi:DNA primase large subunit
VNDLAKYPFTKQAAEYVRELDLKIEDLTNSDFKRIVDRAEARIEESILFASVGSETRDVDVEIASFPIAVLLAAAADDTHLKRRYALGEAKRVYGLLQAENKEKIMEIADNFNWKIKPAESDLAYAFALHFTDFLKNSTVFREDKWKLVNRVVMKGEVYLTLDEAARLLEEEALRHVEEKLDIKVGALPEELTRRVERLKLLFAEKRGTRQLGELPKEVVNAAFPPCIRNLYDAAAAGRRLSHIGRFALTSFLVNIGMSVDEVVDLFRNVADFNERMTRYQVEHIAGGKGSRTKYIPPRCDTLRTHGVCPGMEETCKRVRHPLAYYRLRIRAVRKTAPTEQT